MGTPCSSGVGAPNPGSGAVAFLTNLAISGLLVKYDLGWLAGITGALGQFAFDVDDFCTDGQPALPTITADDVLALANPLLNPGNTAAALKVRDLVLHYLWFELCHCVSVSTPSAPAAQTPPDVVGYGQSGSDPCMTSPACDVHYKFDNINGSTRTGGLWWAGNSSASSCTAASATVTPRTIRLVVHRTRAATGEHEDPFHMHLAFQTLFSTSPSGIVDVHAPGDDYDGTFAVPPGTTSFYVTFVPGEIETQPDHENADDFFHVQAFAYCDQLPGAPTGGCCPPDTGLIDAISQLRTQVDLIQRQAVPFGYIEGATHYDLSGNGHIDVADLIGCKVVMTTIPTDMGRDIGEVDEVFSDSWINWADALGDGPAVRLRGEQQLSFPRAAGLFTRIAYSLRPGLVVAIVELVREP